MTSRDLLDLSANNLEGPILINGIYGCNSLNYFSAYSNKFTGPLPSCLANCTNLFVLDLGNNRFTGELPSYLAKFIELRILSVSYNNLHGTIPQWITNLTSLSLLDLSNNKFSGKIPSHLERLQGFTTNHFAQHTGAIYPIEMTIDIKGFEYNVTYVLLTNIIFDLSMNNLTGDIPVSIGNMSGLRLLNLSGNQLEGKIPRSLSEISSLEELDLAKNKLHGVIPQELCKLSFLASLDVSSNNLCGPIPKGTQFDTFSATSFQRNKCLCGFPLLPCNEMDKPKKADTRDNGGTTNIKRGWLDDIDEKLSLIALELGMGIGFGVVVAMFIVWDKARHWVLALPPYNNIQKPSYGLYKFPT